MKKKLLAGIILFILTNFLTAQETEIICTISRQDYSEFYVTNTQKDTFLLHNDSVKAASVSERPNYRMKRGKGRKKDQYGQKEKHKRYLTNSSGDTLSTLRYNGNHIVTSNSNTIEREATENGWIYVNSDDKIVADVELRWNHSTWFYSIIYYEKGSHIEDLNKVLMLSLVDMAYNRSKCECDDNEEELTIFLYFLEAIFHIALLEL